MNELTEEEVEKLALSSFLTKNSDPEAWVILLNGRMITLKSGKTVWSKKQYASSALTNHLHRTFSKYRNGWSASEVNQFLQNKGIVEIKKL
jgi:hypothetical protein